MKKDRGVALIIVLLVTALLIALIFEFAYGTRVSMRSAVNFRDSQRAYYLARSGVTFAGLLLSDNLKKNKLQDNIEQRDWQVVPLMTAAADTELRVRWEDESGKINITNVTKGDTTYNRLVILFTNKNINQGILDQIADWQQHEFRKFYLLTELHQFMSDEDFAKVADSLTLAPVSQININTASVDVLQSIGMSSGMAERVVEQRNNEPFTDGGKLPIFLGAEYDKIGGGNITMTSNVFKVNSYATVGGFTKQVEAIITRSTSGFTINYWRAL